MPKTLLVFAGPNGSGKSSVVDRLSRSPFFPKIYISPDEYAKLPPFNQISDYYERNKAAANYCEELRNFLLEKEATFAFETVFSTRSKLDFLKLAKSKGYRIEVIFVTTASPQINIKRVAQRVAEGGHDVPPAKIISRFARCHVLLPAILHIAHTLTVYDNSGSRPVSVIYKHGKVINWLYHEACTSPIRRIVVDPLQRAVHGRYAWRRLTVKQSKAFIQGQKVGTLGFIK